jgi:MYXO-CTERM domain-containing protein
VFLDGSSVLGLAAISGGSAAFTTSSLVAGTHPVTATYAGDSDFRASASAPLSQEVDDVATGQPDAGLDDGGVVNDDAGGGRDAGSSGDGGVGRDAGFPAFEAGLPNGTLPTDDSNCGCHVVGGDGVPGGTSGLLAAFGLAIAALGRRRSRKQNRATPSRGARRER